MRGGDIYMENSNSKQRNSANRNKQQNQIKQLKTGK